MFQSEPICILTAGPTVDGRFIEQKVVDDIAELYNPDTYNARINEEHWSWGEKFGSVLSVEKRDNQLFAVLKPNSLLLSTIEKGQLLHTSCEIEPNFAKSGKSYLTGLALTDEPASLGTTQIHLSAKKKPEDKHKESYSTGATVGKELIDNPVDKNQIDEPAPNQQEDYKLFERFMKMFSTNAEKPEPLEPLEPQENEEMDKETKELLEKQSKNITNLTNAVTSLVTNLSAKPPETPEVPETPETDATTLLSTKVDGLSEKVDSLVTKLSTMTDEEQRRLAGEDNEQGYL